MDEIERPSHCATKLKGFNCNRRDRPSRIKLSAWSVFGSGKVKVKIYFVWVIVLWYILGIQPVSGIFTGGECSLRYLMRRRGDTHLHPQT